MLTKRTNILFDEELWSILVAEAVKQKTSVGDLVRFAARKMYSDGGKIRTQKKKNDIMALAGAFRVKNPIPADKIRDYIDGLR